METPLSQTLESLSQNPSLNQLFGLFLGHALGDALGAPFEFRPTAIFTGKLDLPYRSVSRFQGTRIGVVGQVTDDTEMTLALLYSLVKEKSYQPNSVVTNYLAWANNGKLTLPDGQVINLAGVKNPGMGRNTRSLFQGPTTLKGYQSRFTKQFSTMELAESAQSNGSLMRASPLFLLPASNQEFDCRLTNPSSINVECNLTYCSLLKQVRDKVPVANIWANNQLYNPVLQQTFAMLNQGQNPDYQQNRGWVVHAWSLAFIASNQDHYGEWMKWLLTNFPKSDTDTVAAISGAVLGLKLGLSGLLAEPETKANLLTMLTADSSQGQLARPTAFHPINYLYLLPQYAQIFGI